MDLHQGPGGPGGPPGPQGPHPKSSQQVKKGSENQIFFIFLARMLRRQTQMNKNCEKLRKNCEN